MPAKKQPTYLLERAFQITADDAPAHVHHIGVMRLTLGLVCNIYRVDAGYLLGPSRGRRPLTTSRHILHYLVHICFGVTYTQLSNFTNRDRTSVAHACERVEDMRDDPKIDKILFFAELALMAMVQHTGGEHS